MDRQLKSAAIPSTSRDPSGGFPAMEESMAPWSSLWKIRKNVLWRSRNDCHNYGQEKIPDFRRERKTFSQTIWQFGYQKYINQTTE